MEDTKERGEDSREREERRRKLGHFLCSITDWMSVDDCRPITVLEWIVFVSIGKDAIFDGTETCSSQLNVAKSWEKIILKASGFLPVRVAP